MEGLISGVRRTVAPAAACLVLAAMLMGGWTSGAARTASAAGPQALVSLSFDDAWKSIVTNGVPIMDAHGMKSTQFILTGAVDQPDRMTSQDLADLVAGGHELGSHSVTHADLTTLTPEQLEVELTASKAFLEGFQSGVPGFASPYGIYNDTTIAAIEQYYQYHRTVDPGYNGWPIADDYLLEVQNIEVTTTTAEVAGWVADAQANGEWLVIVYHQVDEGGAAYSVTPANFDAQLAEIENSGVPVMTMRDALGYMGGPALDSISPSTGPVGETVTLAGNYFGPDGGASYVSFGSQQVAEYLSWTGAEIQCVAPVNMPGPVPVTVTTPFGTSDSRDYTVDYPPPTITSVSPSSARQGTAASAQVAGTGFETFGSTVVKLRKPGQADLVATGVLVESDTSLRCGFDLAGAAPGAWDLFVQNPDGKSATRAGAFTVSSVNSTWYLAEGSTAWGFSTYITILNPNTERVAANVTFMPVGGANRTRRVTLPASSQTTLGSDYILGSIGQADFSTRVTCPGGQAVAVDRTMSWTGPGAPAPEGHCSVGATAPSGTWYLADGSSAWGFETWTCVQNPDSSAASVVLTYMVEGSGPLSVRKTVPARSRSTFGMEADIGRGDASVQVSSDRPVVAERTMYRNERREGQESIGAAAPGSDFYLAEGTTAWGFTTYVVIQNPNSEPNTVTVNYMTPGGTLAQQPFEMPARSRKTIRANDVPGLSSTDFSTRVSGSRPLVAERSMFWGEGTPLGEACHGSIGMSSPHSTFYFPDGQAGGGYETWTVVANPNDVPVQVMISYLTPTGDGNLHHVESVPAGARRTFGLFEHGGITGRAAIAVTCVTPGKSVTAERSMYWDGRGAGTDTIGAAAYQPQ